MSRKLLDDTGAMKASLLNPQIRIENFGRDLRITYSGTHSELIPIHHFGAPRRGLPARPIGLEIGERAKAEIAEVAFKRISAEFAKRLKGK